MPSKAILKYLLDIESIITELEQIIELHDSDYNRFSSNSYTIQLIDVLGKSITENLKPFRVIQDKMVHFKIREVTDSIQLLGPIYSNTKDAKMNLRDKFRMMFTNWPWHWNFSYSHAAIPREFERK